MIARMRHFFKDILGSTSIGMGHKDEQDELACKCLRYGLVEYMLNISTTADKHTRGVMTT